MRPASRAGRLLALLVIAGLLVGGVAVLVTDVASPVGDRTPGDTPTPSPTERNDTASLEVRWVSDTDRPIGGNHHAVAAARVDGRPVVVAPISGEGDSDQCALVALHGQNGSIRWEYRIPPERCTIHSVADPTVADVDGDGVAEILAATTEEAVKVYDPLTGDVELSYDLSTYGYTRPLAGDVTGDGRPELLVVDVRGSVFVARSDGSTVWRARHNAYVWGQPALADFDADGEPELFVALGDGGLYLYDAADGTVRWNRSLDVGGSVTWLTTGQADGDPAVEIVAATAGGDVLLFDGRTGSRQWRRNVGAFAAVHAIGDGDGDGEPEVYAVARDGVLRALDASDGRVEWTTTLTTEDVQMTPPPALGDVDGDGAPELVAVTNHGRVAVVDPGTGEIVGSHRRDGSVWTHATLEDIDGDGREEIYVVYGDGRVVALAYGDGDGDGRNG